MSKAQQERISLSPEIVELERQFRSAGGRLAMPAADLRKWRDRLGRCPPGDQARFAKELMAVALRLKERVGRGAVDAIAQLLALALFLGLERPGEDLFESGAPTKRPAASQRRRRK